MINNNKRLLMAHNNGCIICGEDLLYSHQNKEMNCSVCSKKYSSNVQCKSGHYVCDNCHQSDANDYIENYCKNTFEIDPIKIAIAIMTNPKINMHGPEHHFLVPAVLLSTYCNIRNEHEYIREKLILAKERSKNILGGFCGFYGTCGAGVGTGIFMSIITNATPFSKDAWKLCNLMTAKGLEHIANNGGPRCCKRDTFAAIETACDFLETNFNVKLPTEKITCTFSSMNKECKKNECKYFFKEHFE
jgi:hypothetical protein